MSNKTRHMAGRYQRHCKCGEPNGMSAFEMHRKPKDPAAIAILEERYPPTPEELAADSTWRLSNGATGTPLSRLPSRAYCGERIHEAKSMARRKQTLGKRCKGCYGAPTIKP